MTGSSSSWRPWRCDGTELPPNVLLMAKLLVLVMVRGGTLGKLGDPFLPFFPWLDVFREPAGWFAAGLRTAFVLGAFLLFANLRVRLGSLLVGGAILLWQFAVKPEFRNHVFICGCLLSLAACHRRDEEPWLLRWQFALVYFGAGLNKLMDPDWWSGQVILVWLTQELPAAGFRLLAAWIPARVLAIALSWPTIILELALAIAFMRRRSLSWAVWCVLALHGAMFVFLVGYRFGHFIDDILIGLLAFLAWPHAGLEVRADIGVRRWLAPFLGIFGDPGCFRWAGKPPAGTWLEIAGSEKYERNGKALRALIRYCPRIYLGLFALDWLLSLLLGADTYRYATVALGGVLAVGCLPIPRRRDSRAAPDE
jgi:hypothetical protein